MITSTCMPWLQLDHSPEGLPKTKSDSRSKTSSVPFAFPSPLLIRGFAPLAGSEHLARSPWSVPWPGNNWTPLASNTHAKEASGDAGEISPERFDSVKAGACIGSIPISWQLSSEFDSRHSDFNLPCSQSRWPTLSPHSEFPDTPL